MNTTASHGTTYNHQDPASREALARLLTSDLTSRTFKKVSTHGEDVYEFIPQQSPNQRGQVVLAVYTSIEHGDVREVGTDAIRVVGLYRLPGKKDRPLAKEGRVNRTGVTEEIVQRLFIRCRGVIETLKGLERCRQCGTPCFLAKSGKPTCSAICWES